MLWFAQWQESNASVTYLVDHFVGSTYLVGAVAKPEE